MRRFVRGVADDHPEIALGRAERHGVPVDEQAALAGPHHVAGVRLSVRNHPRVAAPRQIGSETIGQGEQFDHVGRVSRERLPCRFRERPTDPRPAHGSECGFEPRATGQIEDEPVCHRGNCRCRSVELGEHLHDGGAFGLLVVAEHDPPRRPRTGTGRSCGVAQFDAPSRRRSWGSARPRTRGRRRGVRQRCRTRVGDHRTPTHVCLRASASSRGRRRSRRHAFPRGRSPPSGSCPRRRARTQPSRRRSPSDRRERRSASLVSMSSGSALTRPRVSRVLGG